MQLTLSIIAIVFFAVTTAVEADLCASQDPNIQFICRSHLQNYYTEQLNNATARSLYRSRLLDLLFDDSRPQCFAYELGRHIVGTTNPNLWDSLWLHFKSTPGDSPQPCNELASMLQMTFAKYGSMSSNQLISMTNALLQDECGCQKDDDQCREDLGAILFLLWDDPDPVGIYDLDAAWANNKAGALRLISAIQSDYTWSRVCPMMH